MKYMNTIFGWTWSHPVSAFLMTVAALVLVDAFLRREKPHRGFPMAAIKLKGWQKLLPAHFVWIKFGKQVLDQGLQQFPSCFQISTPGGYKIVVPNRFAEELKSHPQLNINEFFAKELFIWYPGFEAPRTLFTSDTFIQAIVRVKLTRSLGLIMSDLLDEVNTSIQEAWGDRKEWESHLVKEDLLHIVARISSRIFLGKELCSNQEWLEVSKGYTVSMFIAAHQLRMCPALLRPLMHWFIPSCRSLRMQLAAARRLIMPEVLVRQKRAEDAIAAGKKPPKVGDAIGWMVETASGCPVDYVASQLTLTLAAIHTTSETVARCMIQLCRMPAIASRLRTEIVQVVKEDGWSTTSLRKLNLMDSFLKEVQRTQVLDHTSMKRLIKQSITLSDGTVLPAGSRIMVSDDRVSDPRLYEQPTKFKVDRFLRKREKDGNHEHLFASTSSDHLGFGHGKHACPGRFFATNEIKIVLCFVLIKYDCRMDNNLSQSPLIDFGEGRLIDPTFKLQVRKRQEELDLMSQEVHVHDAQS